MQKDNLHYSIITTVIFVISPLVSLPFILKGIYERQKWSYLLFSLFVGIMSYLTIPFADLYRHALMYFSMANPTLVDFFNSDAGYFNWLIPATYIIMNKIGIPFDFLRLFELSTGFYMMISILNYMIEKSSRIYSKEECFNRFLILLLFFDFLYTTEGVRFGYALCLYVYSVHLYINKKKLLWAIVFALVACFIHSSFSIFIMVTYLISALRLKKWYVFILISVTFLLESVLLPHLGFILGKQADWYFNESREYGNTADSLTPIGRIFYYSLKITVLPFVYLLFKYFDSDSKWHRILCAWFILSMSFVFNLVVFQRAIWVFMAMGIFLLLAVEVKSQVSKNTIKTIILCGLVFTILNGLHHHKLALNSDYYRALLPLPFILSKQYEEAWILEYVDGNEMRKENIIFY